MKKELLNKNKNKFSQKKNDNAKTKREKMEEMVRDIKKGVTPNKDYLIMENILNSKNLQRLNCVGTIMCHRCRKIKHNDDFKKGEQLIKCLDWYCGELVWYCESCYPDRSNDGFIKIKD